MQPYIMKKNFVTGRVIISLLEKVYFTEKVNYCNLLATLATCRVRKCCYTNLYPESCNKVRIGKKIVTAESII
jgi:hypothetical protein